MKSSDSRNRPIAAGITSPLWTLLFLLCCHSACAAAESSHLLFSVKTKLAEYPGEFPVLLRLELVNQGAENYGIPSMRGWGGWGYGFQMFASTRNKTKVLIDQDVPRKEAGMVSRPAPIYRYIGQLAPTNGQIILQMVGTEDYGAGQLRLSARLFRELGGSESNEASVEITPAVANRSEGLLDRKLLATIVRLFHNHFGKYRRSMRLPAMVRKVLESQDQTIEAEYALYAGVLQGIATNATDEDRAMAKEAATAFFERFPESWLRAHTCAVLILIARHEGDEAEAQKLLEKGLKLPESNPLFYNVGILPEPNVNVNGSVPTKEN